MIIINSINNCRSFLKKPFYFRFQYLAHGVARQFFNQGNLFGTFPVVKVVLAMRLNLAGFDVGAGFYDNGGHQFFASFFIRDTHHG